MERIVADDHLHSSLPLENVYEAHPTGLGPAFATQNIGYTEEEAADTSLSLEKTVTSDSL